MNLSDETMSWFKMALQLKGSVAIKVLARAFVGSLFILLTFLIYYSKLPFVWHNLGNITNNVVFSLVLGSKCNNLENELKNLV